MTKKSRSYKYKRRRSNVTKMQQDSFPLSSAQTPISKQQRNYSNSSRIQSQNNHYQHLIPEIRRIGILALAIVLVLIVLSFILG
jgi:hypothetical protein